MQVAQKQLQYMLWLKFNLWFEFFKPVYNFQTSLQFSNQFKIFQPV